jgi:hypothetical protein
VKALKLSKVDPLVSIAFLMLAFWGSLMLIFAFTKTVLLPLGSTKSMFDPFIIHFTKSLIFLGLIGILFYAWFKITRNLRDMYLSNNG